MADPERASEYREWAELWITAIPELSDSVPTVTADEIERLLAILETNSHSRDENDQVDLSDPRLPPPPKIDDEHNSTLIGEEDEEEKDEACGLWLVASMANHSCIPNCVVHIPSTRGLQPSAVPTLLFRCIRPVFAGDELTINYQDDEFALTDDRQAQLSSRGFKCTCPLCTSQIREYMRSATCPSPSCSRGASCPQRISGSVQWSCDACGTRLTPSQVSVVEKLQEDWMSLWPSILETLESSAERPAALPFNLLQSLTSLAERRQDPHTFILGLDLQQHGFGGNVNLHISHGYVYAFLKFILFEQSVWLRQRYGDDGVTGTLLAAAAIVERAYQALPELKVASEERRALGYWLVREARTRWGDVHGRESFWDEVESIGWARWTEGMKILYGREDEDMG
ncbi:hypothetical protein PUNSTDRAFT_126513 [Punctularia strigosozonata HHB-11173 SS5]|uniref:uncharacterized protein n=1 Tax=Punctularia strigosozonata (strain HHB-11173) TaxID=741275 RepID=UPI0004416781|nr:uncharacterized protein PUNSTDRAFT_126513 [Punctularia strigosozonata HHB-11173 SS5]EIN08506.1 hypothetical protein PUNSTDRAFT_126513 [Punctularia strigosozonata HHB-11173 SS5]